MNQVLSALQTLLYFPVVNAPKCITPCGALTARCYSLVLRPSAFEPVTVPVYGSYFTILTFRCAETAHVFRKKLVVAVFVFLKPVGAWQGGRSIGGYYWADDVGC